jgi:hypothetical protein
MVRKKSWWRASLVGLLMTCGTVVAAAEREPPLQFAVAAKVGEFLGKPVFTPMQQLWPNRGGWGGVLSAPDGTLLAFRSPGGGEIRRSHDGGLTWDAATAIDGSGDAARANGGNALVDETTGEVLYVCPQDKWLYRSGDAGAT